MSVRAVMRVDHRLSGEPLYVRSYSDLVIGRVLATAPASRVPMIEAIVDYKAETANPDALWVVCCNHGYYVDEEGGAYLWTKRKKHALRMNRQSADRISRYPSLASQRPFVEAA